MSKNSKITDKLDSSQVAEWIALYFESEDPEERDIVFERLAEEQSELTSEFFRAMMHHDEDEYLKAAAAAELAKRGETEAIEYIKNDLIGSTDSYFFVHAVQVLSTLADKTSFAALKEILLDPKRDIFQRREVLLGMDIISATDTFKVILDYLSRLSTAKEIDDELLEAMILVLVRQNAEEAMVVLLTLKGKLAALQIDSKDDLTEVIAVLDEGIALLQS